VSITPDLQAAVTSFSFTILSLSPVSQVDITPTFTRSCSQLKYGRTSSRRILCPGELKKVKKFKVAITETVTVRRETLSSGDSDKIVRRLLRIITKINECYVMDSLLIQSRFLLRIRVADNSE
jgi:hypothetical protein